MSRQDLENLDVVPGTTAVSRSGVTSTRKSFREKKEAWWAWHKENPQVWKYFERFAFEAIAHNRKKISHWLIINRIRWETSIVTTGDDFKISNDYIAFYARLWKAKYPQHKDLFNTKRMIGEIHEPD
jgi:hypothetical protein